MKNTIAIVITGILIGGALMLSKNDKEIVAVNTTTPTENVTITDEPVANVENIATDKPADQEQVEKTEVKKIEETVQPKIEPKKDTPVATPKPVVQKQIITIDVKGGYSPQQSSAKAETPTVLRMRTNATFDCSSSLVIPSISYRKMLPASGLTDIEIPAQKAGIVLQGICGMGMYHFAVNFN